MKLHNTLTNKKEEVAPLRNKSIGLYSCGPTVYDIAHIGNLRTYIFNDLLKRALKLNGFSVKHVMNVTDVDDKTIRISGGRKDKFKELTKKYEEAFWRDLGALNISGPDVITRATEYVDQMVDFVGSLLEQGYAYKSDDGSVYFSINKFKNYGKLSKLDREGIKIGARVSQDEYDKENPADFALWKARDESDGEIYWETKLGKGRPGWHIECSAMSTSVLGETIDIHTGGVDNIFPHHENEIAQSEAKTGRKFVNYWVHGEHLLVDDKKMSKSLGNFYQLKDLTGRGFDPLDFRYLAIGAHYRSKLNFTWAGLEAARNARARLRKIILESKSADGKILENYQQHFLGRVFDDLDTPGALAVLWQMIRDESAPAEDRRTTALWMDQYFDLDLDRVQTVTIPENIIELAEKRQKARRNHDFAEADKIRKEIEDGGWVVEDRGEGYGLVSK